MSWLSDAGSKFAYHSGNAWRLGTSLGGIADNDVSRFFEKQVMDKADLRGSQLEAGLSGVPVVGDVIRGVEGVNQLEDLYNRTGKTVAYPGSQSLGVGSLGNLAGDLSRKIEDGSNDLAVYYSGDYSLGNLSVNGVKDTQIPREGYKVKTKSGL